VTRTALCWATIRRAGLLELADAAAAAGFSHITITPGMYERARRDAGGGALRGELERRGIGVAVIDPLMRGLPGVPRLEDVPGPFADTFRWDEHDAFAAALALGSPIVNVAHYMAAPSSHDEMVAALDRICRSGQEHGLSIALEYMPEAGNLRRLADAVELIDAVGATNLGIMFDTWHHLRSLDESSSYDLPARALDLVLAVQASDGGRSLRGAGVLRERVDRLLPGEGDIPLSRTLRAVLERHPQVVIGVEVISSSLDDLPPLDVARRAHDAVEAVLASES
jgi:sugar phosphate isomerase/epimerase